MNLDFLDNAHYVRVDNDVVMVWQGMRIIHIHQGDLEIGRHGLPEDHRDLESARLWMQDRILLQDYDRFSY